MDIWGILPRENCIRDRFNLGLVGSNYGVCTKLLLARLVSKWPLGQLLLPLVFLPTVIAQRCRAGGHTGMCPVAPVWGLHEAWKREEVCNVWARTQSEGKSSSARWSKLSVSHPRFGFHRCLVKLGVLAWQEYNVVRAVINTWYENDQNPCVYRALTGSIGKAVHMSVYSATTVST